MEMENSTLHPDFYETSQSPEGLGDLFSIDKDTYLETTFIVVSIIGLPGNLLSLIVIISSQKMRRKPFNMFIIHQSAIDFLSCLTTLLLQFYNKTSDFSGVGADIFCRVWVSTSFMWILMLCSSYNLTAMSIERHQAITKPLKHDDEKVRILVMVVAFFCLVYGE